MGKPLVVTLASSSLLRLMDQRYKGFTQGVGQSEILGRVHVAPIKMFFSGTMIKNIGHASPSSHKEASNSVSLFATLIGFSQYGIPLWAGYAPEAPDLKDNVLRVGGGEVSVPFLQEKDIPSRFLDEERSSKQASSSGTPMTSGTTDRSNIVPTGGSHGDTSLGPDFEAKVAKLVELGFGREAVIQALKLFDGNEDQAAGFLFGG